MDENGRSVTDEALVRAIEAATHVDPSPAFVAGVRARIAHDVQPAPWFGWRFAWAVAACAVLVSAVFVVQRNRSTPEITVTETGVQTIPSGLTGVQPVPLRAAVGHDRLQRDQFDVQNASINAGPSFEVVIAADEAAAIRRLLTAGPLNVEVAPEAPAPVWSTADIVIPAIKIDPLVNESTIEGVEPW